MNYQKCGTVMVIDEWCGWQWTCFNCDYVGRDATNEEIEKQESEIEAYLKSKRNQKE